MNVLLTGSTGFIGGYVLRDLVSRGHSVIAPIRGAEGPETPNVRWLPNLDFSKSSWMDDATKSVDVVIHAAAYAHQTRETTDEDRKIFEAVNVELTKALYRASANAKVEQFIFISSIGAIRSSSRTVVTEETPPQPDSDYARSKLAAEKAILEHSEADYPAVTILRPCLVYGKGNPGNLERLASLIQKNIPLPFKSLTSHRSFLFVDNLVDAIATCVGDNRAFGRDFIVADDQALSVPELIEAVADAQRRRIRMFPLNSGALGFLGRLGDLVSAVSGKSVGVDTYSVERLTAGLECDNSKLKETLQWRPPYSTQEGIRRTFGAEQ